MRRCSLGLAALLVITNAVLVALLPGTATAAADTYLRLTHLSPDTPNVDVTITSSTGRIYEVGDFGYGNVTTYQAVDPGTYTVAMRPTGATAGSPIPLGSVATSQGRVYTAAVLGPRTGASVTLFTDDLTRPGPGSARVRVVQAAQGAGSVTVAWNGTAMAGPVAFGTATDYVNTAAGHGTFGLAPMKGTPVTLPVDLADGGVYTVMVLQRGAGDLAGVVQTDALDNGNGGGSGGSGGGGSGNGGGQYPHGQAPPPTPKRLFEKISGSSDWAGARDALYGECANPGSDSRQEGFSEEQCKAAADDFLATAEVDVDTQSRPQGGNHCEATWSGGHITVATDGTTDCKKVFGDDNRPKPTTAPPAKPVPSAQLQLRVIDPSGASSTVQPPSGGTTTTEPPVAPAPTTPAPPNTEPPPPPSNTEPPPSPRPPAPEPETGGGSPSDGQSGGGNDSGGSGASPDTAT